VREPNQVFVQVAPTGDLQPAVPDGVGSSAAGGVRWSAAGVEVRWSPAAGVPASASSPQLASQPDLGGAAVLVSAAGGISRVALRWDEPVSANALILGDAWERSYGDLQWRHLQPDRFLPWYWLGHDEKTGQTFGAGVDVHPGAFCSWTVDQTGFTLWLDLRNGGGPTQLAGRELTAAVVRSFEDAGTPWLTLHAAVEAMSQRVTLKDIGPIVGANNWYYAYGEGFDNKAVLQDAATVVELADGHPVKPFSVVDDGWNPGGNASGGPWESGISGLFDDMAETAAAIKEIGARPGLWFRPLLSREQGPWGRTGQSDGFGRSLDPTHPEVVDLIRADLRRFKEWGFELVKHDFSTYDLFGRFGPAMGARLADDGWQFHDTSRTTAEIILDLYGEMRAASDGVVLIGCNTVGHLAAGLVDVQRTGDDTSGRDWERTRKMGINSLAFRLPQHNRFFTVDADCVPCTPQTPWELNRQFLELVARSGTALFVSVDPAARTARTDRDLGDGIRLALSGGNAAEGGIEPLDWLVNTTPVDWRTGTGTARYAWSRPWGADPVVD
jgi:alpha-galactosidase